MIKRILCILLAIISVSLVLPFIASADSSAGYICQLEGGAAGDPNGGNSYGTCSVDPSSGQCDWIFAGYCSSTAVCDDKVPASYSQYPCAEIKDLQCKCKSDNVSFTCGINGTNDFTRACGQGSVCDPTKTTAWPCTTDINPTNAPKGSTYNPCPNNVCDTVFGPINVADPTVFVQLLFRILLSVSGFVALLLIIVSGYQFSMSQGNPEKLKNARERLIAAIIGLLFIIFSVTILQIIGMDVLGLPSFGK